MPESTEAADVKEEGNTQDAPAEKLELPSDIADDERRDFERTGTLELYELRREAERISKEKERLREEVEAAAAEEQKRKLREQLGKDKPAIVLPADANEMERKDFERTGTLELYDLNREGDRLARERIKIQQELANRAMAEEHKRALRAQVQMDRFTIEAERNKLALPPPRDPNIDDAKPIPGSERLPEVVKSVLRRLFGYGSHEWTEENQIGLVNLLLAMGNHKAQDWAYGMKDALASDVYGSHDLSPRAILQGSTGLKAIAGPRFMGELKALAGGDDGPPLKALADERHKRPRGKRPKKRNDKRDDVVRVKATRVHEDAQDHEADDEGSGESDEDVIDDSPNQDAEHAHDPWGEFD